MTDVSPLAPGRTMSDADIEALAARLQKGASQVTEEAAVADPPPKPDPVTDLLQRLNMDTTPHQVDTVKGWLRDRAADITVEETTVAADPGPPA